MIHPATHVSGTLTEKLTTLCLVPLTNSLESYLLNDCGIGITVGVVGMVPVGVALAAISVLVGAETVAVKFGVETLIEDVSVEQVVKPRKPRVKAIPKKTFMGIPRRLLTSSRASNVFSELEYI